METVFRWAAQSLKNNAVTKQSGSKEWFWPTEIVSSNERYKGETEEALLLQMLMMLMMNM